MLPDWVLNTFREFPLFAAVAAAIWVVVRYNDRRYHYLTELQQRTSAEITRRHDAELVRAWEARRQDVVNYREELDRLERRHQDHLRSKDAEIRRLDRLLKQEMARRRGET